MFDDCRYCDYGDSERSSSYLENNRREVVEMSFDVGDAKSRAKDIKDYADELTDSIDELWDAYIEVSKERDELLERVKELEGADERSM